MTSRHTVWRQVNASNGVRVGDACEMFESVCRLAVEVASLETALDIKDGVGAAAAHAFADAAIELKKLAAAEHTWSWMPIGDKLAAKVEALLTEEHGALFATETRQVFTLGRWGPRQSQLVAQLTSLHEQYCRRLPEPPFATPSWGNDASQRFLPPPKGTALAAAAEFGEGPQRKDTAPPFGTGQAQRRPRVDEALAMLTSAQAIAREVASLETQLAVSDPVAHEFSQSLSDACESLKKLSHDAKTDVVDDWMSYWASRPFAAATDDALATSALQTLRSGQWAPGLRRALERLAQRKNQLLGLKGAELRAPTPAPQQQVAPLAAHQGESTFEVEQQATLEAVTSVDLIAAVQSLIPNLGWEAKVVDTVTQQATPVGAPQVSVLPDGQGLAVTMLTDVVTTTRIEASGTLALENIVSEVKARAATRLEVVEGE